MTTNYAPHRLVPILVRGFGVSAVVHQSAHRIGMPERAGPDQRCGAMLIDVIGIRPSLEQQPRDVTVAPDRGAEQGTGTVRVDVVGIDPTVQQLPDDVVVACRRRIKDGVAVRKRCDVCGVCACICLVRTTAYTQKQWAVSVASVFVPPSLERYKPPPTSPSPPRLPSLSLFRARALSHVPAPSVAARMAAVEPMRSVIVGSALRSRSSCNTFS